MPTNNQIHRHPLYQAALDADDAYTLEIVKVYGPRVTRWTLTPDQKRNAPTVQWAYDAKVAADAAWHEVSLALVGAPSPEILAAARPTWYQQCLSLRDDIVGSFLFDHATGIQWSPTFPDSVAFLQWLRTNGWIALEPSNFLTTYRKETR